jgi:hypothetical protein
MKMPGEVPVELGDLQGAWRREGRSLSDGPPAEVADVLWLQVGRNFCDLRTPFSQSEAANILDTPQAFSGTVQVDEGAISFHHDLDSLRRDPAHPDAGTVHRKEGVMFERGPGFEERWVLVSRPGDRIGHAELRRGGSALAARLLRVGPVALAVWGGASPGGAHYTEERGWGAARSLGDIDPTMEVDRAARGMGKSTALPRGWVTIDDGGS